MPGTNAGQAPPYGVRATAAILFPASFPSMNVLVWATTFGADLWSFTKFLDGRSGVTVKVVMDDPDRFRSQGVHELFPLDAELVERRFWHYVLGVPGFDADVTIMDNRTPFLRTAPKALMLWHGFGWKGPDSEDELWWLHRSLRRTWGDVREPNPDFIWQCFGPWDKKHRTEVTGLHPDNCHLLGAASHDDLRTPMDRSQAQPYYPFDVADTPTVLVAPTWHYGEVFDHWGTDADLIDRLVRHIGAQGANVILRLHDSYRFEADYRAMLDDLAACHEHVMLKYKDRYPDNYLDLQVADALITNYSSIANLFYATGRPTIHVYPVADADEAFMSRAYTFAGVLESEVESARHIWKLPPEEHGGLLAHDFEQLLSQVEQALANPDCCRDAAQAFLDEHMLGGDERNCERIWEVMQALVEERPPDLIPSENARAREFLDP